MYMEARLRGELARIAASSDPGERKATRCLVLGRQVRKIAKTMAGLALNAMRSGDVVRGRNCVEAASRLEKFGRLVMKAALRWKSGALGYDVLPAAPDTPWTVEPKQTWRPGDAQREDRR